VAAIFLKVVGDVPIRVVKRDRLLDLERIAFHSGFSTDMLGWYIGYTILLNVLLVGVLVDMENHEFPLSLFEHGQVDVYSASLVFTDSYEFSG